MNLLRIVSLGVVLSLALLAGAARAQTAPHLINFQGLLSDSLGQPLPDGAVVDLLFAFYGEEGGGTPYLSVFQEDVVTAGGRFAVLIGSGTITPGTEANLADLFQKHSEVWLGMRVDGDSEMAPRTRIGSVPYAVKADDGVPKGGIIMWSGALTEIPAGWQLCDGSNGTPDLRDRFVLGVAADQQPGGTGGSAQVSLSASQLPAHAHAFQTDEQGSHQHVFLDGLTIPSGTTFWIGGLSPNYLLFSYEWANTNHQTEFSGLHGHSGTTNPAGAGQAVPTLPPYYTLAFIMKL
ncbi:MAG: hypothetical protein WC326_06480 [Candidatus Delongbacteria bacterium]